MIDDIPEIEKSNSTIAINSIPVMDMIQGITKQEYLDLLFQKEYNKLTQRAKNILNDFGIVNFKTAYKYYSFHQGNIDYRYLRTVGLKTNEELIIFFEELKEYFNSKDERIEEESADKNYMTGSSFESNQNHKSPVFNNKMELKFQVKFKELTQRTKNILYNINAATIKDFYYFFFIKYPLTFKLHIRSCGVVSAEEIKKFRKIVKEIIDKYESQSIKSGLFYDIDIYFKEVHFIKFRDREIFFRYYRILETNKKETLQAIGIDFGITRERVRQIGLEFPIILNRILENIKQNGFTDTKPYFKGNYFMIDDLYANNINTNEGTHFSKHFICYALSQIIPDDYNYYSLQNNLTEFSGIFFRKDGLLNIPVCWDLIRELNLNTNTYSIKKIDLEKLLEHAGFTKESCSMISYQEAKVQLVEIIGFYINSSQKATRQLIMDGDFLFIKPASKIWSSYHIVNVLKESKKPLHFIEIYERLKENDIKIGSFSSVHSTLKNHPEYFGLKGHGKYGLREWGGYFGTVGDVTEQILRERKNPIPFLELKEILCRELSISKDSIITVLFHYKYEDRFVRFQNSSVGLKSWFTEDFIKIHRYKL
jgi:hypothetical protein